jgi:hypothetical protein
MLRSLALAGLSVVVLVVADRWGSFVAGGSDSYCYVHQAERWASGRLQVAEPLALEAPWPDAALAFAPAGHRPSSTVPGAIVPICPSGLSIAMAPFVWAGGSHAAFLVVPLFGVLLVLATDAVGRRYGTRIGLASAALVAASPAFLYQVIQPMSDVPAAALWMAALAYVSAGTKARPALAGLAASAAIVVRPNLLPLGMVIGLYLLVRPERSWRTRIRDAASYAAACVPGCLAVLAIQQEFFGSPFSTGYGSASEIFALANVAPNLARYPRWLLESHTAVVALAFAAPVLLPGALSALLFAFVAVTLALYLPYTVFEDWSYLRFLLPGIPALLVLTMAAIDDLCRRAGIRKSSLVVMAVAVMLSVTFVRAARDRQTFRLQGLEARYERAGTYAGQRLPPHALIITSTYSGSVRFYAHRPTLVWDGLPPDRLDQAIAFVRERGFEPYLMLDGGEEPAFRSRFAGSAAGALDWPPKAEVGLVRVYDPDDRARYQRGEAPPTEYVR